MRRIALTGKKRIRLLLPVVFLAFSAIWACDPGSEPNGPTGPDSNYDPTINPPTAGISARVRPSRVTVPDPITGGIAEAGMTATFRDANGSPQQGLPMNFSTEPVLIAINNTPVVGIAFNPSVVLTNGNGLASTTVQIHPDVPPGSYTLVASTSPTNAPTARAYATLYVNEEPGERIDTPSLIGEGSGFVGDEFSFIAIGPSITNLGNPVCYEFDYGDTAAGNFDRVAFGITRVSHTYVTDGVYLARVRGTKCTDPTIVSEWSEHQTISIGVVSP